MQLDTISDAKRIFFLFSKFFIASGSALAVFYTLAEPYGFLQQDDYLNLEITGGLSRALVTCSPILYLTGRLVSLFPSKKRKPSFKFHATEWRIERRPGVPDNDELCQWFVTRLEKEELDEDEGVEPLVLRKVAIVSDRCVSFHLDEDVLDDHLLWEHFDVRDRRGLDGKIFASRQVLDGHLAMKHLLCEIHESQQCSELA